MVTLWLDHLKWYYVLAVEGVQQKSCIEFVRFLRRDRADELAMSKIDGGKDKGFDFTVPAINGHCCPKPLRIASKREPHSLSHRSIDDL